MIGRGSEGLFGEAAMLTSNQGRIAARRSAFTLIELLVVIGIIAVLISVLLPTLAGARKSADKAKCLAALHQIGDAYKMYQLENKGAWPVAIHFWLGGQGFPDRDKRYHDYIARFLMGTQRVTDTATGTQYTEKDMNTNGTCSNTTLNTGGFTYATKGPFGTTMDPIWIGTLRDRNSVLWGCPSWTKIGTGGTQYDYASNNGYTMSIFPQAPLDLSTAATAVNGVDPAKTARVAGPGSGFWGNAWNGNYFKMTSWKAPGDRALLFDGVHNGGYFNNTAWNTGTPVADPNGSGVTFDPTDPSALLPPQTHYFYALDWNRHTKSKPGKVKNSDIALNVLFCDGHAATLSTREAYKAIRFK
jgi:prepilin-type N-terminal cleavage/methylation domain-containing protein/prepilin-type processing-associated H-X9-DG protein